jgi:protein-L-isoaspartate(D-aspartate) O-methyltransferase
VNGQYGTIRDKMVQEQLIPRGITDNRVLEAMRTVPRHCFVDDALQSRSYGDFPLPISSGQTISQPCVVASMTQALVLKGSERVLEIGTGSGYQAAVLSQLCEQVFTVERINILLAGARRVFDTLKYYNIMAKLDDGTLGWSDNGPYDAIIVTAGGPSVPGPLIEQLADPGRLVIPVGDQHTQNLQLVEKKEGEIIIHDLGGVRFVDLIGKHGWK